MKGLTALVVLASWAGPPHHAPPDPVCTAPDFAQFSAKVWKLPLWERGAPKHSTIAAQRKRLKCAGPGHRKAMRHRWRADRAAYYGHRKGMLARSIDHRWAQHWAPDFSGETLPFHVAAALFEAAGLPGVTFAQIAEGESGLRPGSAGVDPGGTVGYGILAVTSPFSNSIVAKYGGYPAMFNPVNNAAAAADIYRANGVGAWYGISHVTAWDAHYTGRLHLPDVLGGKSFGQALRR